MLTCCFGSKYHIVNASKLCVSEVCLDMFRSVSEFKLNVDRQNMSVTA